MATEVEKDPAKHAKGGKAAVIVAILLILGQGLFAIFMSFFILHSAYTFAGSGAVGSIDELYRLGDGPKLAFASVWLMPFVGGLGGLALLLSPVYRWAWLAPVGAMLLSTALCLYFISTFDYVAPQGG